MVVGATTMGATTQEREGLKHLVELAQYDVGDGVVLVVLVLVTEARQRVVPLVRGLKRVAPAVARSLRRLVLVLDILIAGPVLHGRAEKLTRRMICTPAADTFLRRISGEDEAQSTISLLKSV